MSDDLLEQQESTPDTFYDAQDYFENLSNDLEDPVEDFFFYDCDIPSEGAAVAQRAEQVD